MNAHIPDQLDQLSQKELAEVAKIMHQTNVNLNAQLAKAKNLFAQFYQVLGAHNANENALDAALAASDGNFDFELCPYVAEVDVDGLRDENEQLRIKLSGAEAACRLLHEDKRILKEINTGLRNKVGISSANIELEMNNKSHRNKILSQAKIEALESCISDNAMNNDQIDALIIYVDDVRADIEQLRRGNDNE